MSEKERCVICGSTGLREGAYTASFEGSARFNERTQE